MKSMMGGKLELERDDKKLGQLKRPDWMNDTPPSQMTDDQKKEIKEFEVKQKAFQEDQEVERKVRYNLGFRP